MRFVGKQEEPGHAILVNVPGAYAKSDVEAEAGSFLKLTFPGLVSAEDYVVFDVTSEHQLTLVGQAATQPDGESFSQTVLFWVGKEVKHKKISYWYSKDSSCTDTRSSAGCQYASFEMFVKASKG